MLFVACPKEEGHSRSPDSEQEIIYIGDSGEEDDPREAVSDLESDGAFSNEGGWTRRGIQDDDHAPSADWGSASEFEEAKEVRQESDNAWDYIISRQDEDVNIHEPGLHQSQGKESDDDDDDDGGFIAGHGDPEEDGRNNDNGNHSPIQRTFPTFLQPVRVCSWLLYVLQQDVSSRLRQVVILGRIGLM
jgi:hypothetical protein